MKYAPLGLALLLFACGGDSDSFLRVSVRTDFVPGVEFSEISIETEGLIRRYAPNVGDDFVRGISVADFDETLPQEALLTATLLGPNGERVLRRSVAVTISGPASATIVLTRSCLNVACPGAGAADATQCDNGVCVTPECSPETPEACGESVCQSAEECPQITESCGEVLCTAGECLFSPIQDICGAREACVPGRGCVSVAFPDAGRDAGSDAGSDGGADAGSDAGGPADAGFDSGIVCNEGEACEIGNACELGVTDCSSGTPECVSAGPRPDTFVCRPADGECDAEETCDGVAPTCPVDDALPVGTECGAGFCNGQTCGACAAGAACDPEGVGNECATGTTRCDAEGTPSCEATGFRGAVECRPSAGPCDIAESCTGDSPACPADGFRGGTSECRAASGVCDVAEFCPESGPGCPADSFRGGSFECRATAGTCDVPETCTGSGTSCPADTFRSSSTECRSSAGSCDVAETCTGASAACPSDGFRPSSFECRASGGLCDVAETCSGASAGCPSNAFRPSSFECRASAGSCDVAETCTGGGAGCPSNAFRPSSFTCREAVNACDVAESCTGSGATCPGNGLAANGTVCAPPSCGAYGACTTTDCMDATQSRTCTPQICSGGVCGSGAPGIDSRSCVAFDGMQCSVCGESSCVPGPKQICDGACIGGCCSDAV